MCIYIYIYIHTFDSRLATAAAGLQVPSPGGESSTARRSGRGKTWLEQTGLLQSTIRLNYGCYRCSLYLLFEGVLMVFC